MSLLSKCLRCDTVVFYPLTALKPHTTPGFLLCPDFVTLHRIADGGSMRALKIILAVLFVVLAALTAFSVINERFFTNDTSPVISCPDGVLEVSVNDDDSVFLSGVFANDAEDGDISGDIIIGGISKMIGGNTAKVTLIVFDSDSNMASCTRTVKYTDYEQPHFSVDIPLVYKIGETVSISNRISAFDVIDGDLTQSVRIISVDVSTQSAGVNSITVQVTNSLGNTARLELPLIITEEGKGRCVELTDELVYIAAGDSFDPYAYIPEGTEKTDITYEGSVDTSAAGTYYITYKTNDSVQSAVPSVLTVVVE